MKSMKLVAPVFLFALGLTALFLSRPKPQQGNSDMAMLQDVMSELQTPVGANKYHGLYESHCSSCHGPQFEGNAQVVAPSLNAPHLKDPHRIPFIAQKILDGGIKMPSFAKVLTQKQVIGLSLWLVFTLRQKDAGTADASPTQSTAPFVLKGKIEIKSDVPSSATLFIFGKRNSSMQGPPLLVKKLSVTPIVEFELSSSDVMAGAPPQPGEHIFLQAKTDLDGNPMTQDGSMSNIVDVTITPHVDPLHLLIP